MVAEGLRDGGQIGSAGVAGVVPSAHGEIGGDRHLGASGDGEHAEGEFVAHGGDGIGPRTTSGGCLLPRGQHITERVIARLENLGSDTIQEPLLVIDAESDR